MRKKGAFSINDGAIERAVKILCIETGRTLQDVGNHLGISQSNFGPKLRNGKLTRGELEKIAEFCGVDYVSYFELADGTKI